MSNFKELIDGDKPVVVDLFAEWCGPCKAVKPNLDEFKKAVGDKATVLKIDVDRNPAAAQAYRAQGLPTLAIFKKGAIVWRRSGAMSAAHLQQALARLFFRSLLRRCGDGTTCQVRVPSLEIRVRYLCWERYAHDHPIGSASHAANGSSGK